MAQTYTKDKIDQLLETAGTTVVANPDPAGTTALTGIQIGDTKYAVGGGDKIYRHTLFCRIGNSSSNISLFGAAEYYSTKSDEYTKATLSTELKNRGATNIGVSKGIPLIVLNPITGNAATEIYLRGSMYGDGSILYCEYVYFNPQATGNNIGSSAKQVQVLEDSVSEL